MAPRDHPGVKMMNNSIRGMFLLCIGVAFCGGAVGNTVTDDEARGLVRQFIEEGPALPRIDYLKRAIEVGKKVDLSDIPYHDDEAPELYLQVFRKPLLDHEEVTYPLPEVEDAKKGQQVDDINIILKLESLIASNMNSASFGVTKVSDNTEFARLRKEYADTVLQYLQKLSKDGIGDYKHKPCRMTVIAFKMVDGHKRIVGAGPIGNTFLMSDEDRAIYEQAVRDNGENCRNNDVSSSHEGALRYSLRSFRRMLKTLFANRQPDQQQLDEYLAKLEPIKKRLQQLASNTHIRTSLTKH